jgi:hypothetical protein
MEGSRMNEDKGFRFVYDQRLGIELPQQDREWWEYSLQAQAEMIERWEAIKARIPDRIKELEKQIDEKHHEISREDDWERVCQLYEEYFAIASVINDLNIWAKVEPGLSHGAPEEVSGGLADEHTTREK